MLCQSGLECLAHTGALLVRCRLNQKRNSPVTTGRQVPLPAASKLLVSPCDQPFVRKEMRRLPPPGEPQLGASLGTGTGHSLPGLMLTVGCSEIPREGGLPGIAIGIPTRTHQSTLLSNELLCRSVHTPGLTSDGGLPQLPASYSSQCQRGAETGPEVEMGYTLSFNKH